MTGFYSGLFRNHEADYKPIETKECLWMDERMPGCIRIAQELPYQLTNISSFKQDRLFTVITDASDFALGAVLSQLQDDNKDYVVSYASKKLNDTKQRYHNNEKKGMAAFWAIHKKYR